MSANTQTNTVIVAKEKKEKKPTLSAKYSKFLIFGYGFVKSLEAQGALNAEGVEAAFAELKLMSSVEEQTQLYENLLTQSKESGKAMRKFVTLRNKPPKAPRAKKPRAKKNAAEPAPAAAATETPPAAAAAANPPAPKVKAPRVKKATVVENDTEFDLIGQIVAAANTVEAAPTKTKEEKEAEKKAAKEAKAAEKVTAKAAKDAEKLAAKEAKDAEKVTAKAAKDAEKLAAKEAKAATAKEAKEAKAAAKTAGTTANLPKEEEVEEEVEEEEDEIHTTEVVIEGKPYLVDEENNVYSVDTHEPIGTFNADTQTISADL
jgi:hypothetical protein